MSEQVTASDSGRLSGTARCLTGTASQPTLIDLNTENDGGAGEGRAMKDRMNMEEEWRGTARHQLNVRRSSSAWMNMEVSDTW